MQNIGKYIIKTICKHGDLLRLKSRNFLVIPERKKLFVILAENKDEDELIELCDGFASDPTDCYVFIISSRKSPVSKMIADRYGKKSKIKSVAVSKHLEIYLHAADAVIVKSMSGSAKIIENVESSVTLFADNVKDLISKITRPRKEEGI